MRIALDQVIAPLPRPADTRYVKHVEIPNERLSRFWGRPVSLGAVVVLPEGWHEHPEQRYPLAIFHGHFQPTYDEMREEPPDPALPPVDLEGLRVHCPNGHEGAECTRYGYERLVQERAHAFFRKWTSPGFPRAIVLLVQHANPYYDDSYAVNSENLGPYGDAITLDLVPEVERRFRGLGPWARALYGGSTGGWESLAAQVLYPDALQRRVGRLPRPHRLPPLPHHRPLRRRERLPVERALAVHAARRLPRLPGPGPQHGRAGVDARAGAGHALPLRRAVGRLGGGLLARWGRTATRGGSSTRAPGAIDREVAASWRERFDLVHVMRRDWATLGPKLRGKIHVAVGLSDNFFLNDAVYRAEEFLSTASPPADAEFVYGARDEHCFNGDTTTFNAVSRLGYTERFLPRMAEWWVRTAPPGADVSGWRGAPAAR